MSADREGSSFIDRILLSPLTWFITALNIGLFLIAWIRDGSRGESLDVETLLAFGAAKRVYVQHGEYWRLLTAVFLHGGWFHLLWNTWGMFGWCASVERSVGWLWFAFAYLTTGIGSFAVSILCRSYTSVGASGAAFGLVAVTLALLYRRAGTWQAFMDTPYVKQILVNVGVWVLLGFTMLRGIDNFAHLGGFALGIPCGLVLGDRKGRRRPAWLASLAAYILVWVALVVVACIPGTGFRSGE
jgi:rhomboid protease GluP